MKKFMTIFVSALLGFAANAQMMPDSTVQFVAYWNVGDKYQYNFESIDKEVDANGDTTIDDQSDDDHYPTSKNVYEFVKGEIGALDSVANIQGDDEYLGRVVRQGAERARETAAKTLREVREIMGIKKF